MAGVSIDRLQDRVGESVRSVEGFTVEAGKVAEFAAAVGDDNPIYRDAGVAAERGHDRIPAPLTFTRTSMFDRYRPEGVGRLGFDLGFDVRAELHGEQVYEFTRPVYVGDTLTGTTTLTDAYERDGGAGGSMTFAVLETEYTADGDPVVTERSTLIQAPDAASADADADAGAGSDPKITAEPSEATVHQQDEAENRARSVDDVAKGDGGPTVTVEGLTPRDFVKYAGASGDFNPIHYDQEYARELGNPGVFGQGMLTAGFASHFAADWFGVGNVDSSRTRFTERIWPGDTLTVEGEVTAVEPPRVTAEVSVTRQTRDLALSGEITASFED